MKAPILFLFLAGALCLGAQTYENSGGQRFYPASGVIHPSGGTVQITLTPNVDLKDLRDGWPFAFCLRGAEDSPATRTSLGIYSYPGKGKGPAAIIRTVGKKAHGAIQRNSPVKAGESVNMAVTWGPDGFYFYQNGRLIGNTRKPVTLLPFCPSFSVGRLAPFFVSRIMVSTRQLPQKELQADPLQPFRADPDCSLLGNDPEHPEFFAAPKLRKEKFYSLEPFDFVFGRIRYENEELFLRFSANNFTDRPIAVPVTIRISRDGGAEQELSRTLTLPAGTIQKELHLPLPRLSAGFYRIQVQRENQSPVSFTLSIQPEIAGKEGKMAEYLGTAAVAEPEILKRLGIRWARSWGRPDLVWHLVEPQKGKFDFRTADRMVDGLRKNGVHVLGVLGYPPLWAAEPPPDTKGKIRYSESPGRWKPRSGKEWSDYVRKVAEHFKGRVSHYEIYNECDFKTPGHPASFSGSTEEYFELLKRAAKEIRSADPRSKVLVTGFSMIAGAVDSAMPEDLLRLGAADVVDIWNLHSYQALLNVPEMKAMVHARKPEMPFWQTEHMWHLLKDPDRIRYLSAAINFWFLQEGFEKFFTFGWNSYLTNEHTQSPQLPLHVFGVCQQHLRTCEEYIGTHPQLPKEDFDVRHVLKRTDGSYLTVLGSSVGNYRLTFANPDLAVRNESGASVALRKGVLETGNRLYYLQSAGPLKILSQELIESEELLSNPGFEELSGDAAGGIEHCTPIGWIIRTVHEPGGSVTVNAEDGNGTYALNLTATGKGRGVYVFEYLNLTAPGAYRISARFRTLSGSARPYLHVYGTDEKKRISVRKNFDPPVPGKWETLSMDLELPEVPRKAVAVIFGAYGGTGTLLLDDVRMHRLPAAERIRKEDALLLDLSGIPLSSVCRREGGGEIRLSFLKNAYGNRRTVGGIPFSIGENALAARGKKWENAGQSFMDLPDPAGIAIKRIFLLGSAMYCTGEKKGTPLAEMVLEYADSSSARIPLRKGIELDDWYNPGRPPIPAEHRFRAPDFKEYSLFSAEWENPYPERKVKRIGLVPVSASSMVVLPAVTLERRR